MSVSLEKAPTISSHEQSRESFTSPEIEEAIDEIQAIDDAIAERLGIDKPEKETDAYLVEKAELPGASSDEIETALISGALEATGQRTSEGDNPIQILELDGYGVQITDIVKELHEAHATLPDGEQAAAVLAQEIDRVAVTYLHGSNYTLKIGDKIRPGDGAILKNGEPHASATTDESTAWSYALAKENLPTGARDYEKGVNRRGRVYEVVTSDGKPAERLGPQKGEVNSSSFTVVGYRDVQPGRQGTIPEVNWKEYSPFSDANHITEDPLVGWENDYKEPYQHPPNDIPLPGLGDNYVRAEQERIREASGIPPM